jgi:N utilization substance protein B
MGSRRHAREIALQMLYLCDNCRCTPESARESILNGFAGSLPMAVRSFSLQLFEGIAAKKEALDAIIENSAENWEMNRMACLDRNILRLAAFEITDMHDTPINVIINEAVEIAKRFSTDDSGKFVNGILDNMKTARKPAISPKKG